MNAKPFLFFCFFLFCAKSFSQGVIQTDRPDHTEGVFIVDKNTLQIESGFLKEFQKNDLPHRLISASLIKYGISKNFEIQSVVDVVSENGNLGILPLSLGFKANFWKEKGPIPEFALIARRQLKNFGTKDYRIDNNHSMIRLAFQNHLSSHVVVGYNTGIQWNDFDKPSYILSSSVNVNLSANATFYAEFFNETSTTAFFNPIVDVGAMVHLHKDVIVDVAMGKYLYEAEDTSFYYTLGLTTRLDFRKLSK